MNSPPPTFNLLHEPWIPVRPRGGGPNQEVGLRRLLTQASSFQRIDDPSPLVTVALLRLSLALLHRALKGPKNTEQAAGWLRDGFPTERLDAYLVEWQDSFDLFHPETPFWQIKIDPSREGRYHWSLLSPELNGSNTTVVFGTKKRIEPFMPKSEVEVELKEWLGATIPAHIARLLVQNQGFALGGRITGSADSQQGGPVMSKALFLPYGGNLLETLCLNLLPYPKENSDYDRAVWEWQKEGLDRTSGRNVPLGLADRYTWLSRGISIIPVPDDSENITVSIVGYGAGVARVEDENWGTFIEPMAALISKKVEGKPKLLPLGLSIEKLAWRDLQAILPEPQDNKYTDSSGKTIKVAGYMPLTIQNASRILDLINIDTPDIASVPVHVFGQILGSKPGITVAFREESYSFPVELLTDWQKSGQYVHQVFEAVKNVGTALQQATGRLATEVISRGGESALLRNDKEGKKLVARLSKTLPGLGAYWAALEAPFRVFLAELDDPEPALSHWKAAVTREARRAWELNLQGAGGDGQVAGFAYRPRRTDGKHQPSPQALLDRALNAMNASHGPPESGFIPSTQEVTTP